MIVVSTLGATIGHTPQPPPTSGDDALADGFEPFTAPAGRRPAHPGDGVGWESSSAGVQCSSVSLRR
jgi:hypothetical protein